MNYLKTILLSLVASSCFAGGFSGTSGTGGGVSVPSTFTWSNVSISTLTVSSETVNTSFYVGTNSDFFGNPLYGISWNNSLKKMTLEGTLVVDNVFPVSGGILDTSGASLVWASNSATNSVGYPGQSISTANGDTSIGYVSIPGGIYGANNTAVGYGALAAPGSNTTTIGLNAFGGASSAGGSSTNNTIVGANAWSSGFGLGTLIDNTVIGSTISGALSGNPSETGITLIGARTGIATSSNLYNSTAVGYKANIQVSSTVVLGSTLTTTNILIGESVPVNRSNILEVNGTIGSLFGIGTSTLAVSSNTILSGTTFYQNGPIITLSTMTAPSFISNGSGAGQWQATEGSAPSGIANADIIYADSTNHAFGVINNNGSSGQLAILNSTQTWTAQQTISSATVSGQLTVSGNLKLLGNTIQNNTGVLSFNKIGSGQWSFTADNSGNFGLSVPNGTTASFGVGTATPLTLNSTTGVTITTMTVSSGTITTLLSSTFTLTGVTNASLGTSQNGTMLYCSDCTVTTPATCVGVISAACVCTGSGNGAFAKRLNGAWYCN